jgi:hypothetical protein
MRKTSPPSWSIEVKTCCPAASTDARQMPWQPPPEFGHDCAQKLSRPRFPLLDKTQKIIAPCSYSL